MLSFSSMISICINYNNYLHQLFYMEEDTKVKPISDQPRAKWFTSMEDLKKTFEKFKAKDQKNVLIPVVFHHEPMGKKVDKDVAILMVTPQTTVANMIALFQRMVIAKYKQHQKQRVYIFYSHRKYLVAATDHKKIQQEYNRSKDKDGFLHISYYFQGEYFRGPDGIDITLILLSLPLIIAIEGTKVVYNWTAKAASNLTKPLLLFGSQQRYKFKDAHSLQARRQKHSHFIKNHPNHVMIIVEKHQKSKLPDLPFIKFLAKQQLIYGQLTSLLQNRIRTVETEAKTFQKQSLFFSINNKIPDRQATLAEIYQRYKHQDNIIYITYQQQETF